MSAARSVLLAGNPPRTLRLAEQPIGRGGQAVVYAGETDPALAIKLYYEPAADIERRLEGMLRLAHPDEFLTADGVAHPELAWPLALVRDPESHDVIGYAMRRVGSPDFFPLGVLFHTPQRRTAMAEMSWRFLVGVARNLAGLVAALHARGLVLGDVSHANIVVSRQGYLTFLDCDSMQFVAPCSGEHFPCLVFTAEYAAPELHRGGVVDRTPESDSFSLAVLVCRLLLMGDHPFMGVRTHAPDDDDSGMTDHIRDGYSYLVRPEEMSVPANQFDPELLPPAIRALVVRALGAGHSDPAARPSAAEWVTALGITEDALKACADQRLHVFGGHHSACPWCTRAAASFSDPFAPARRRPAPAAAPAAAAPAGQARSRARLALALAAVLVLVLLILVL